MEISDLEKLKESGELIYKKVKVDRSFLKDVRALSIKELLETFDDDTIHDLLYVSFLFDRIEQLEKDKKKNGKAS